MKNIRSLIGLLLLAGTLSCGPGVQTTVTKNNKDTSKINDADSIMAKQDRMNYMSDTTMPPDTPNKD